MIERRRRERGRARVGVHRQGEEDDRCAGVRELDADRRADQLGEAHHVGAGLGGRSRRPVSRHGDEAHGDAGLREHERRLDAVLVVDQRLDGADEVAHRGAAAQLLRPARDHRRHFNRVAGLALALHHALKVLARVVPGGVQLVQRVRVALVGGRYVGPPELDGPQVVDHPRDRREVVLGRRPANAGVPVDDLGAAAVGGVVGLAACEVEVERTVARTQPESPRGFRQRGRHEVGREAHDTGRAVHLGAVLGEDVQRLGRAEADSGPLEHAEHRVLVPVELRVIVEPHGEVRSEREQWLPPAEVELRGHRSPLSRPAGPDLFVRPARRAP